MRRLVLFDIDGTLVQGGPAKEAFRVAMVEVFGTAGDIEVHSFAGKTDPQIARELLTGAGLDHDEVDRGLPRLWEHYLEELERRLPHRPVEVLPGVVALLDALRAAGDVALGLVTGNIAGGARLKLGAPGLFGHFRVGGYGSDHEIRNHLPGIAMDRARAAWETDFSPEAVWVVGDTPRDVACGRWAGARTLAVATGSFDADTLRAAGPHRVVEDLADTDAVVEVFR
jgi:phosphoglycolate phosphatase-like HAD superfamily hydrolase